MFQATFNEAKYLTLGVGVVNVAFTLVAVSTNHFRFIQTTAEHTADASEVGIKLTCCFQETSF